MPIYKTIEQSKRVKSSRKPFDFNKGDSFPERPPSSDVWGDALMNRNYKSMVISIITKIMAAKYNPPIRPRTLLLDFCNVVKISYGHFGCKREVLETLKPMGESDVKFLRYIALFGNLLIESVDSDVLLIAMQFMQRHKMELNIYVRRIASRPLEESGAAAGKRKAGDGRKRPATEYEIINVKKLLLTVHSAIKQAVGGGFVLTSEQMTRYAVFLMLITGSDYSKKIAQIGPSFVWDHLHVSIPMLSLCCMEQDDGFMVDEQACIDMLFVALYKEKFQKHVQDDSMDYASVYRDLQGSKLNDRTKSSLPDQNSLVCLIRTVSWTMRYWELSNENPPIDTSGAHGFILTNGKIEFGVAGSEGAA